MLILVDPIHEVLCGVNFAHQRDVLPSFSHATVLQGTDASRVSSVLLNQREDGNSLLWQSVRGLWSDLMVSESIQPSVFGVYVALIVSATPPKTRWSILYPRGLRSLQRLVRNWWLQQPLPLACKRRPSGALLTMVKACPNWSNWLLVSL